MRNLSLDSNPGIDPAVDSLQQIDAVPKEIPRSISDADPIARIQDLLVTQGDLDRQMLELRRYGEERRREILRSMLDVADGIDRIIRFANTQADLRNPAGEKLIESLESVRRIMQRNLGKANVKRLSTLGAMPDTEFCEIHSERDAQGVEPGTVVEELLPGYTIDDKLLRAASVIVAAE